ncbi:MAG TPA: hypothetical protein PLI09_06665 [Candidatus Hydrogenedentes bacterium]|nr:hypothetical protein [Candidatus Hydrogenedentota bacterium]
MRFLQDHPDAVGFMVVWVLLFVGMPFLAYYPWQKSDKRKLDEFLGRFGKSIVSIKRYRWPQIERISLNQWTVVRKYTVSYVDQEGNHYQTIAKFYPIWRENGPYIRGLEKGNFKLLETDTPEYKNNMPF